VYPILAADEHPLTASPLINWMMACGMSSGNGKKTSMCLVPNVQPTLANDRFLEWTIDFVDRMLAPSKTTEFTDKSHIEVIRTTRPTAATLIPPLLVHRPSRHQ
jgi:hypothetical protein